MDEAQARRYLEARDPRHIERVWSTVRAVPRWWHRAEVRDVDRVPDGACVVVSNHSGGIVTFDAPIFYTAFAERFGFERPAYLLAHDWLMRVPIAGGELLKFGIVPAHPTVARLALEMGGAVLVFPGGDRDVYRPTSEQAKIDFHGRRGYVDLAAEATAPIVPVVSIGGQETQWFVSRGERLARWMPTSKIFRTSIFPLTIGIPFGWSLLNLPLPSKIVVEVLDPVRPTSGQDVIDTGDVDEKVRATMQKALDGHAAERRLPVLG